MPNVVNGTSQTIYRLGVDIYGGLWLHSPMNATDPISGLNVGDRVIRTQGRPANVGRTGILMTIHNTPDLVGSAADVLVTVIDEQSGTTFQCYSRQLAKAGTSK